MEIGQRVYMNTGREFVAGEVTRVTPAGLVDVKFGHDGAAVCRFNKDGKRRGDSRWSAWTLDEEMSFEARTEYIQNDAILAEAGRAINNIKVETVSFWYGRNFDKADLTARLDKLQGEIDNIRALLTKAK